MFTAYYDLDWSPPTYDIVSFLSAVEVERIKRGEAAVQIVIISGSAGGFRRDNLWPHTLPERRKMLANVAVPMARMLPSSFGVAVHERPARPHPNSIGFGVSLYGLSVYVDALRAGCRPLRPTDELPRDDRLVTITLREAEHWPERNSDIEQWVRAANEISAMGYKITIVRDTHRAESMFAGHAISVEAAVHLEERARLYRSAVCNLFVNNGPAWLCVSLDAPALIFKPLTENGKRAYSAEYHRECGIPPGSQLPTSPDYQRIVWEKDNADVIVAAFKEFANARMETAA